MTLFWQHNCYTSYISSLVAVCYHSLFHSAFGCASCLFLPLFFAGSGSSYGMWFFLLHLSRHYKCVLAVWSPGVTCIHFVTHSAWILSQLFALFFACICADGACVCAPRFVVFLTFMLSWCSWECVGSQSGRGCSLFIIFKDVLSVSVRTAEWLQLLKPFSSPWSSPGDCCVDATLTAITDKFKRL